MHDTKTIHSKNITAKSDSNSARDLKIQNDKTDKASALTDVEIKPITVISTPVPFRCSVLIVDDEPGILDLLTQQLKSDFRIYTANSIEVAKSMLATTDIDIVLSDLFLPDGNGVELLDWVRRVAQRTGRVLLTGTARIEDTIGAVNQSRVHRVILKPWKASDLITQLRDTARVVLLERNHEQLLEEYRKLTSELENRVQNRIKAHEQSLSELRMKNQILEKMALTDPLTGLPNRRAIDLVARKELLRRTRTPAPLAIGLIDADRFKDINSKFTLSGGDHVLSWLGQVLQYATRATDAIARVGGEEFMIVAPTTDYLGAQKLAERVRLAVCDKSTIYNNTEITLSVSGGYAVLEGNETVTFETMREVAAAALAEAKQNGRNCSVIKKVG